MLILYLLIAFGVVYYVFNTSASPAKVAPTQRMDASQARAVLGVSAQAGEEEVREAWRRLLQKNHPDHGGSAHLASLVNQAKDVLLGK